MRIVCLSFEICRPLTSRVTGANALAHALLNWAHAITTAPHHPPEALHLQHHESEQAMSESSHDAPRDLRDALSADKRRRRRGWTIAIGGVAAAAVIGGGVLAANLIIPKGSAAAALPGAPAERLSLKIATAEDSSYQDAIAEVAEEKGLDLEWVNVDDWVLPNTELVAGTVDANAFQHILFLSAFNTETNADITPVFSTVITQWGIFSAGIDDLEQFPEGGRIAIPDDPSNGGRALFILEAAGLIDLADGTGAFPTTSDVVANPHKIEFVEIGARTIPQQFDDPSLAAVVVGTSYFEPSQGVTKDDALFLDDPQADSSLPYVNVVATRADNVDNPAFDILETVYDDPRVSEALAEETFGNSLEVEVDVETLRTKLAELEQLAAENS